MPLKNKDEYNSYMNEYMKKRWEKRRKKLVELLGGKCVWCGSSGELDFDHIDPSTKIMTIGKANSRSEKFLMEEVKKCQLLCKPCHIIKHQ